MIRAIDQLPGPPTPAALADLLVRTARAYLTQESRNLACVALGPSQRALLERIGADPGLRLVVLAEQLRLGKSTVTRAVRQLERNRFVERRRSGHDGRAWELYLTRAGDAALRVAGPDAFDPAGRMVFGFDRAERLQLQEYLQRLDANLGTDPAVLVRWSVRGTTRTGPYDD